jgi:hypothetical protein
MWTTSQVANQVHIWLVSLHIVKQQGGCFHAMQMLVEVGLKADADTITPLPSEGTKAEGPLQRLLPSYLVLPLQLSLLPPLLLNYYHYCYCCCCYLLLLLLLLLLLILLLLMLLLLLLNYYHYCYYSSCCCYYYYKVRNEETTIKLSTSELPSHQCVPDCYNGPPIYRGSGEQLYYPITPFYTPTTSFNAL